MPSWERITAADVNPGDRIARTRNELPVEVIAIDEGPVARRFHLAQEVCEGTAALTVKDWGTFCPVCHRGAETLADKGHGHYGGGNIRPRRTAKLWRAKGAG